MAFLCLNNGAAAGLLVLTAYFSGFGHVGPILIVFGVALIAASLWAKYTRAEDRDIIGAYLMQGLALGTGGVIIAYTGMTRGLLVTVESVFLIAAGAYSRNRILRVAGYLSALLGTGFLLGEISAHSPYAWALIVSGAVAMFANAWLSRREFWSEPPETARQRLVWSSAYYILLGLGIVLVGCNSQLEPRLEIIALALTALGLTAVVYLLPLYELPPLAQFLLVAAQAKALFSWEDHSVDNVSAQATLAAVTFAISTWWPRQKKVQLDQGWKALSCLYALAMVALGFRAMPPHFAEPVWLVVAAALSILFFAYGKYGRNLSFSVAGQIFLFAATGRFFFIEPTLSFPWPWWTAAGLIATLLVTAQWAEYGLEKSGSQSQDSIPDIVSALATCYRVGALAILIRAVFGLVPSSYIPLSFFALGAATLAWGMYRANSFTTRCALVLDLFGTGTYLLQVFQITNNGSTWSNAIGVVLLMAQAAILRRLGTALISSYEIDGITIAASTTSSFFVYFIIQPNVSPQEWMMATSLVALVFWAYGAWTRSWPFLVSGHVYLAISVYQMLALPAIGGEFPWTWWAAAVPVATVYAHGWLTRLVLPRIKMWNESVLSNLAIAVRAYEWLALGLLIRWVFGVVALDAQRFTLLLLGTGLQLWSLRRASAYGVRCSFVLSGVAVLNYLLAQLNAVPPFNGWDAVGFALLLSQPATLRHWGRELVTMTESWTVIILSTATAWLFVSNAIAAKSHQLTLGWAVVALVLTLIGFIAGERRQRWCGLGILLAAMIRGGIYDFWQLSNFFQVLTFFALTVICLGLSFLYYRFADRLKEWL